MHVEIVRLSFLGKLFAAKLPSEKKSMFPRCMLAVEFSGSHRRIVVRATSLSIRSRLAVSDGPLLLLVEPSNSATWIM